MSKSNKAIEDFWSAESMVNPMYSNIERFAMLFAANKNSLMVSEFGVKAGTPPIGLLFPDVIELQTYSGIVTGFCISEHGKQVDEGFVVILLNRLIVISKRFGYNQDTPRIGELKIVQR